MSNVNNIHSILNGKWMIQDQFSVSLYPYLLNMLTKGELPKSDNTPFVFYASVNGSVFSEDENNDTEEGKVAILSLKGPVMKYSQVCGPMGTKAMKSRMQQWENDNTIVGVLLDIDSGGGQASGTGEFAKYVFGYSKPVVTYTDGSLCSGAYYIASGSKEIVANQHADAVGSIGTMIKYLVLDGYYKKLGAKLVEEYATKSTQKNNSSRKIKEGSVSELIRDELDPINEVFHKDVKEYRPAVKEENFNGHHTVDMSKALDLGLIDKIGTREYAINRVFELASKNNSNQKQQVMAESNTYSAIAATIGEETLKVSNKLLSGKTGVFLTEDQLASLESKLTASATELEKVNTDLKASTDTVSDIEAAVDNAMETAGLEASEAVKDSIALLGDKVKEYGGRAGTSSTKVTSGGDDFESDSYAIIDSM